MTGSNRLQLKAPRRPNAGPRVCRIKKARKGTVIFDPRWTKQGFAAPSRPNDADPPKEAIMTVNESKSLKKGTHVYWRGDAADSGIVTETSWDAVSIAWNNGQVALVRSQFWSSRMISW